MAGRISNDIRDDLFSLFRERVAERMGVAPFLHQREVWAASDGLELTGEEDENGVTVRLESGDIVRIGTRPREAGRARFLADLGAFKIGKSFGAALWAAGFAAVPGARVALVGLEYNICEPEFNYLLEFLCSDQGMSLKPKSLINRPRQGDMFLEFENGARFECKSWERKEALKGKENDAYIYCEAYQLPGIECFTSFSQNLRARRGYAYFATTPDRPWIKLLHQQGHGGDSEWHCTCSVPSDANPYTFDARAKERDRNLMTKEKYAIHYEGRLGDFVGRVFPYQQGDSVFTAATHPDLFSGGSDRNNLHIPVGWEIVGGADTGTYYSALITAFSPEGEAFVIDEFPNYRYVGGEAERNESLSIPRWAANIRDRIERLGGRATFWADPNSQFKSELRHYGVTLLPARIPVETRTEIAREYFEHKKIWIAPWITELPYEIENAAWPEEVSLAGKFARLKQNDHILDPLEHILARRPLGRARPVVTGRKTWLESNFGRPHKTGTNVHLGRF